jgi:hypothetical protein
MMNRWTLIGATAASAVWAQHNHLASERSIFGFKSVLRLEWRDQDGKDKT